MPIFEFFCYIIYIKKIRVSPRPHQTRFRPKNLTTLYTQWVQKMFFFVFSKFSFFRPKKIKNRQKRAILSIFDHNFGYNWPTNIILVSTPMFLGTGNRLVTFTTWLDWQGCQILSPGLPNNIWIFPFWQNYANFLVFCCIIFVKYGKGLHSCFFR